MFTNDKQIEIANEMTMLSFWDCWACDRPYTMAKEIPSNTNVTVNVINLRVIYVHNGTAKLVHMMSYGSGAL